jgi:predicted dehydrogenase
MINCCIIGCGNSAHLIDKNINKSKNFYSHLSVLFKNKKFKILCCSDNNQKNLNIFAKNFKDIRKYTDYKKMFKENNQIQLVILLTPATTHYEMCKEITKYSNIKFIICEKPFGYHYNSAKKILALLKKKKIKIVINYQRRWDPFYHNLKKIISDKKYGKLISIVAQVDKALYTNSSHMIDIIIFLAKDFIYSKGFIDRDNGPRIVNNIKEFGGHLLIKHKNNVLSFIKASADNMYKKFFELELNFTNARIKIENDNFSNEIFIFKKSKNFKNYQELSSFKKNFNKLNYQRINLMYEYVYKKFHDNDFSNKDAKESIKVLQILNKFHPIKV